MCTYDRQLNSSGKGTIGWGVFSFAIGLFITLNGGWGWINLGFGLLLIATGIYEMKVREPKVIRVSAAVLGLLAVWNIAAIVLSAYFHTRFIGHGLWIGIAQIFGATSTWKQYDAYAKLRQAADLLRPHASGRLVAVGVAGSLHAAQALEAWCGRYGIPVIATGAARLYTGGPALAEGDRILLISQSGETPELLEWIDPVRARHQELVVLVNDENSTLASAADLVLPMEAGPELGPASKTFMSRETSRAAPGRCSGWFGDFTSSLHLR